MHAPIVGSLSCPPSCSARTSSLPTAARALSSVPALSPLVANQHEQDFAGAQHKAHPLIAPSAAGRCGILCASSSDHSCHLRMHNYVAEKQALASAEACSHPPQEDLARPCSTFPTQEHPPPPFLIALDNLSHTHARILGWMPLAHVDTARRGGRHVALAAG